MLTHEQGIAMTFLPLASSVIPTPADFLLPHFVLGFGHKYQNMSQSIN